MTETIRVELEGRTYQWNGQRWFDIATQTSPPRTLAQKLDQRVAGTLDRQEARISDPQELMTRAKAARDAGQTARAEKLVRRVLKLRPGHKGALAIYTSLLRRRGAPEKALEVSEPYRKTDYPPLLVSRAAALCDLERWQEAKRVVGRALALTQGSDTAALGVASRIKAAKPDLYE